MTPGGENISRFWLASPPPSGREAIAVIEISGDARRTLEMLGIKAVASGAYGLRSLGGIDDGLVAVWDEGRATLMPHGGPAVVATILEWLVDRGLKPASDAAALTRFPEARDEIEAEMLAALAHTRSPMAVPLLLEQPRRWREHLLDQSLSDMAADADVKRHSEGLGALLHEPLVALAGRPNMGKSTMLNALAKDAVSIVADERGTTRDYVGVGVLLAGLAVRVIDTPGLDGPASCGDEATIDLAAARAAMSLLASAALIVSCGDPTTPPLSAAELGVTAERVVTVCLRSDLLTTPMIPWANESSPDCVVSCHSGQGLEHLSNAVRDRLVAPSRLANTLPWKFW